jgi:hypothetical protein
MKRFLIILSLLLFSNIPLSCIEENCGNFTPLEARIKELSSSVGTFYSDVFSDVNSTDFHQAAIQIRIINMEYSEITAAISKPKFSFINAAYACSPPDPEPTQTIDSISITSESPVYSQKRVFSTGESLNELFTITEIYYSKAPASIAEFIENQKSDLWLFGYTGASIVLQLKDKPDSTINQTFTIDFKFSDAKAINIKSQALEVDN